MKRSVILCGFLLWIAALPLNAEESLRGRLPDGRAFRTDANGVQLVDYVAELELSIEELNRRIQAMENEADSRNRGASGDFRETDLLNDNSAPRPMLPGERNRAANRANMVKVSDCPAPDTALIERLERENSVLKSRLELAVADNSEVKSLSGTLAQKEETIAAQKQELARLTEAVKETEALKVQLASLSGNQQEAGIMPVAFRHDARASFRPSNSRAISSTKSTLRSELNRLKGYIRTRDVRYKTYRSRGSKSVSFSLNPAVSSRGISANQLDEHINRASSLEDLAELQRDVKDISIKVRDDIGLIERMLRR